MKVINVCGFNISGCTAAFDFLYDYENFGTVNREFHETGFLKCKYSFGGAIQSVLLGNKFRPTKEDLFASLMGDTPKIFHDDISNLAVSNHLKSRKSMLVQYGSVYATFTKQALSAIPDDVASMSESDALSMYSSVAVDWMRNLIAHVPEQNFPSHKITQDSILLFKNDPPGKFPYMASLIPNGVTVTVLRDPFDACFDFNRFYNIDTTEASVTEFCSMLASWLRTAVNQLKRFSEQIGKKYYVVRFEDLVQKDTTRQNLLKTLGLESRQKVGKVFSPQQSSKNVGLSRDLAPQYKKIVSDLVMKDFNILVALLGERELLIK